MRTGNIRIGCLTLKESPGAILEPLWEALAAHAPAVEWTLEDPNHFYLDAAGMGVRYGDEGAWCRAVLATVRQVGEAHPGSLQSRHTRLGVAGTRFTARVAAYGSPSSPGYSAVVGPDARFLAGRPLDLLPLDPDSLRRLRLYGIHTMGELAALPATSVVEQLGPESLTAWRLAAAQDVQPVVGRRCQTFTATHLYDEPESRLEALIEGAARLAERALLDLPVARPAWAIRRAGLQVEFASGGGWSRESWLGDTPGSETVRALLARMLGALRTPGRPTGEVEGEPPEFDGVIEMTVSLLGLEPAGGRQLQLFEAQETDSQWRQIVSALTRKHAEHLVRAEEIDPEAVILPQRYAFRALQP